MSYKKPLDNLLVAIIFGAFASGVLFAGVMFFTYVIVHLALAMAGVL